VLGALAGLLYLVTLCRGVYWYDSAEYVTAAYTLGVPHPPGYPLYTLLARLFLCLPLSPALAVNAMSALCGAVAVALAYANARMLGAHAPAAVAAGAMLASSPSFWTNATVAEVYTPGLCFTLLVLLVLLRAQDQQEPRLAVGAAALAGAGMGVHYSLASLGLGFALLAVRPAWGAPCAGRARKVLAQLGACALAALLAYALVFSYVVLRAGSEATPNQAAPLNTAHLLWLLTGGNYRFWFEDHALWPRALHVLRLLSTETSWLGAVLAALGVIALARRDRWRACALLSGVAGNVAVFFRYRVDDLEVFLLPSVALLCLCAGAGLQAIADRVVVAVGPSRARASVAPALVACGLALSRVWSGFAAHDLSAFSAAQDYGERLAVQLPYKAVILNYTTPEEWKFDAVFGMYFQHVLERRRDVVVVSHADRPILNRLIAEQRPTYLYAPVAHVAREYVLAAEGDLYRLLSRR
jgi:hypothetical protein